MPVHPEEDTKGQKGGQRREWQVQSSIPETQSTIYTKTLKTNNKMPNRVLQCIVFLRRKNFAQQFIVSGNVFMELHARRFRKIVICTFSEESSDRINSRCSIFLSFIHERWSKKMLVQRWHCVQGCWKKFTNFKQLPVTIYLDNIQLESMNSIVHKGGCQFVSAQQTTHSAINNEIKIPDILTPFRNGCRTDHMRLQRTRPPSAGRLVTLVIEITSNVVLVY